MKILHIFDHSIPLQSGYSFRSRSILREQQTQGLDPIALTGPKQGDCPAAEETLDGLTFFRTPGPSGWLATGACEPLGVIHATYRRVLEVAARQKPDLLHAHSPALNGVAAIRAGRKLGLPVVYEVRAFWEDAAVDHGTSQAWGPRYRLTRALETWVLKRADHITTICDGLRQEMAGRGIAHEKITLIPNAVDLNAFNDSNIRDPELLESLGIAPTAVVLGFVGSFYAYEGLDLLIEAFASLAERHPALRLLFVGGGPEEAELKRLAAQSPAASRIVFSGRVPHREVSRYYDCIDLLVYPRRPMRLTDLVTPLKPLEAMASHKMFLASDVGGHRELIEDGVTGSLFTAGRSDALVSAVDRLLSDRDSWPRMLSQAYDFVTQERTWTRSVGHYSGVYAAACGAQQKRVGLR